LGGVVEWSAVFPDGLAKLPDDRAVSPDRPAVRPNRRAAPTRRPAVEAILTENWRKQGFLLNPAVSVLAPDDAVIFPSDDWNGRNISRAGRRQEFQPELF
jgi:hypothetical protein